METYKYQRNTGSTIFRAKTVKEAMSEARQAFGEEAVIVSCERVGAQYCIEVAPNMELAPKQKQETEVRFVPPPIGRQPPPLGSRDRAARIEPRTRDDIENLEERYEAMAVRVIDARSTQGVGLSPVRGIREGLELLGFAEPLLGKLGGAMVDSGCVGFSKEIALKILSSWLRQIGDAFDFDSGWHAIVGPAGSGKTTTIAKLASRAVAIHGSDNVGLITTDFYRIGAYEQLRVFGELMGIKVLLARSPSELRDLKYQLATKKVVFVDTIGTGRDDDRMRDQMRMFAEYGISCTMALQACLSRSVMRADLARWKDAGAKSAVITKLDQAIGISAVVESLIIRGVPVKFATTGQRVPADLHKVSPLLLAHKALRDAEA